MNYIRKRAASSQPKQSFLIIANLGDQASDLAGGCAEHAYKIPNPFYYTP
jgi:hypothetical protein